jgi:thiosulfate sulfurtransferase
MTTFKHLQISELPELIKQGNVVIADIRDPNAFAAGHIHNAVHLTNETIADFIREADIDAPVVVCCYHGHSSQQAAQYLISQDFTDVYSLDGGFSAWQLQHPDNIER